MTRTFVAPTSDMVERIRVRAQILGCESCDAREKASNPVPFSGSNPNYLVCIGEAPGVQEDKLGQPFVGPAGGLLRKAIDEAWGGREASFSYIENKEYNEGPSDYFSYLNTISCYPAGTPTQKQVKSCQPNLWAQLDILRPRYGLLLGGVAMNALVKGVRGGSRYDGKVTPPTTITELRGKWVAVEGVGWGHKLFLMVTWHPSAVMREGGLKVGKGIEFANDIRALRDVVMAHKEVLPEYVTRTTGEQLTLVTMRKSL